MRYLSEFLIRADDHDFLMIGGPMEEALHPPGCACERIEGWGDYRMRCNGIEVAVSFEEPGIQLVMHDADGSGSMDSLAEAIAVQVATVTGRSVHVVPL